MMVKLLTFLSLVFFLMMSITLAQQESQSIFDEPHELNVEYWLQKFPHSFIALDPPGTNQDHISDFVNINISNDPFPQNEPSVKISRANPNRVVAAWRDFRTGVQPPLRRVGYSFSTDGGQTWSVSQLLPQIIPNVPLSSDPVVGVDLSGNFYIYTVSLNENTGNGELWVFKSTNQGETFNEVYEIASGPWFEDKEWATADLNPSSPFANSLYLSWTRFSSGTEILLTKSTDEGITWSNPVSVSDDGGVQGSVPAVGLNGELYIVWRHSGSIVFDKSTDGGQTFGNDVIVSSAPNAFFPSIEIDRSNGPNSGYIYVTWNDETHGDDDVFFSFSSDGGNTWSSKLRVNDDSIGNGKLQYWPWVAVSEIGEIAILFYDTRNTPNNTFIEAYLARSTDGGVTFTNELISSEPTPTNIPNSDVRFGDYINLDIFGGKLVAVWTDERAGGFDMEIYSTFADVVVPVELVNFLISIVDGRTVLEWNTATETNNLGFEIERRFEGGGWVRIGFVEGNGTTTEPQKYSFKDEGFGSDVYYRLKQIDFNGRYTYSNVVMISSVTISTIELSQNYPNPFNPRTKIKYQIANDGFVNLVVFNSLGQEVISLVNENKKAGSYEISLDATELPSGIYIYRLNIGNYTESKKMILLR